MHRVISERLHDEKEKRFEGGLGHVLTHRVNSPKDLLETPTAVLAHAAAFAVDSRS
jgi:hypothetical protein